MKILYLEDNVEAVYNLRRITAHFQHELWVADSVATGLVALDQKPDLILADMLLTDGNALTFLKAARQVNRNVPIVILTGYASEGEKEACFAAGCTEYFIKPVDVNTVIQLFQRYQKNGIQ